MFGKGENLMSLGMVLQSLAEILAVGFVIWGLFNEKKLVKFEDNIRAFFRRKKLKVTKNIHTYNKNCA